MKPETLAYLVSADRAIANARSILAIKISDQAARLAYYAQFHAAQALIFERTGKVTKTHKGVGGQFHKLAKAEVAFPPGPLNSPRPTTTRRSPTTILTPRRRSHRSGLVMPSPRLNASSRSSGKLSWRLHRPRLRFLVGTSRPLRVAKHGC